jgi:hypothetical protein
MRTPLVTFFADIDGRTYYSDHAKRFIKNCRELNMPFIVRELQSKGDYRLNCLSKPRFLYDMIKEINVPFVWMDVDSIMHKQLNAFDDIGVNCDLAFAFPKIPTKDDNSIALPKASPIFINNTAKAIQFLWDWVKASDEVKSKNIPVFDHEILIGLFKEYLGKIRVGCLPPGYCIWPGSEYNEEKYITMGLADSDSKKTTLKQLGFNDDMIEYQSVGNKFIEVK